MRRLHLARALIAVFVLPLAAAMSITVAQLTDFIKSSVEQKIPDKGVAQQLRIMQLTDRLDADTIENLQSLGAGPKTVDALKAMSQASAKLAPPAAMSVVEPPQRQERPAPNSIEQARLIDAARDYALNYSRQLPNFICLRVIRRYYDPSLKGDWQHGDTITAKITYFEQKEEDTPISVSDRPDAENVSLFSLGGTMSVGEFGMDLRDIFSASSHTRFEWDRWGTLDGRWVYVFSYEVQQENSSYTVKYEQMDPIITGYKGLIYLDKNTGMIVRFTLDPIMPSDFPVKKAHTVLDYDYQKIGDSEYLLPLKSVLTSRLDRYASRNETEFRMYHRYGAEATVTFGDDAPPPLPDKSEDKTNQKPQ